MSRFKIGQKVVALHTFSLDIKKGVIYEVDGFSACQGCGELEIFLKGFNRIVYSICAGRVVKGCGYRSDPERERFAEAAFAPLQNNADAIEYRLIVSEPEMEALKLKEVQHQ